MENKTEAFRASEVCTLKNPPSAAAECPGKILLEFHHHRYRDC